MRLQFMPFHQQRPVAFHDIYKWSFKKILRIMHTGKLLCMRSSKEIGRSLFGCHAYALALKDQLKWHHFPVKFSSIRFESYILM